MKISAAKTAPRPIPSTRSCLWQPYWWLLGSGVALWVFLPTYQFTNLTGDWFELGWPWKSGGMKVGYVSDFNSLGLHPYLSATLWLNLLTWGLLVLALRLLLTLKNRRWPIVLAKGTIIVVSISAIAFATPALRQMAQRWMENP